MDNPPQASPSPLWRVALIAAAILAAGLLLVLWPVLSAVSSALTGAIEAHGSIIGVVLLLAVLAVLAGLVRAVWAWSWRIDAKARQARMVPLQNGQPIDVKDVHAAFERHAGDSLRGYYAALLAEAERPTPLLTSQNVHLHNQYAPPATPEITEVAPPQLPQIESGRGTLAQLHQIGHVCRSGNSLLVGYADGQPQYIELAECGFVGIGGKPRVGKSTTTLLMIEQAVLSGWHVFVGDPHIHKADGLLKRCLPLSGRLAKQATTPDEIAAMIYLVDKIGRRRVQGDSDRTPVLLIIDEFTNLVWRDEFPSDIYRILPSMAIEYAGVGVHGVIISHDYSRAGLGNELGAALRRSFTHRIAHKMDPGNVEFLLPKGSAAQSRAVLGLKQGQALYHGPDGAAQVAVPWLVDDDAAYAAQGTPPRPYAPRQIAAAPAPAQIPPTTRVPVRQAVPTVPMTPLTVQEEILLLLRSQSTYLTASEVAAKLGADLAVVRTEIDTLYNRAGQLVRRSVRSKTTKEKYEYQIVQPTQPVQPNLTPSA